MANGEGVEEEEDCGVVRNMTAILEAKGERKERKIRSHTQKKEKRKKKKKKYNSSCFDFVKIFDLGRAVKNIKSIFFKILFVK